MHEIFPLIPPKNKDSLQISTPKVSVEITNEENETSAFIDKLIQLIQDLDFLRKFLMNLLKYRMIREIKKIHNSWRTFPLCNNIEILPSVL